MKTTVTRKGILKAWPLSATIVLVLSLTLWASNAKNRDGMITIIMAKDTTSFVGGAANTEIIQKMVDASIVEVTQVIDDISFAYECLFPYGAITDSTKILIKYNPLTSETTRKPMVEALKHGLTYMLDFTFPAENISIVGNEGTANTTDTIFIDTAGANLKYVIKDLYAEADFIIFCPSAWGTDVGCGVDMCLNLMTSSVEGVNGANMNKFYDYVHDTTSPSLSLLNYHPIFNGDDEKVVLYMMDLLSYSGTGNAADLQPGYKIYTTQNITVCDWKGIRFLKDTVGAIDSLHEYQAQKVCSLSVDPIDLGVVNEGQMLEVAIGPPWTVGIKSSNKLSHRNYISVKTKPEQTAFILNKGTHAKTVVSVYDIRGREIWSKRSSDKRIVWNNTNLVGNKVPSGVYVYQVITGDITARGKTTIKR